MNNFKKKYLKYKKKYIDLKNKLKGGFQDIPKLTKFYIPRIKSGIDDRDIVQHAITIDAMMGDPEFKLDLVESLVGVLMGLNTNLDLINRFYIDIRDIGTKTFIIDYQNLHLGYNGINNNGQDFLKFLAKFIYEELKRRNKIIIIYKPHNIDIHHEVKDYQMDVDYGQLNPIIKSLILLINEINVGQEDNNYRHNFMREHLNIDLFIIYTKFPEGQPNLTSSYDDLLFWIISIAFWNIYEILNQTDNIFLLTNDSQKTIYNPPNHYLNNNNDKNIFNFQHNFNIYKTVKSNDSSGRYNEELYVVGNSYLHLIIKILNEYVDNENSKKLQISNLTLREIHNFIFINKYLFEGHIPIKTYFQFLRDKGKLTYCYSNFTFLNRDKTFDLFPPGICFYAFIKYIQNRKHGNPDGAYEFPDMFLRMNGNNFYIN